MLAGIAGLELGARQETHLIGRDRAHAVVGRGGPTIRRGAGAACVVIMNEGTNGRRDAFSGQLSELAPIPVVGVSYELGRSLDIAAGDGAIVRIDVNAVTR